jgi:Fe-S-cluster containining protein
MPSPTGAPTEQLCLECGLCCNGVIFADVHIQTRAEATRLRGLGMSLLRSESTSTDRGKGCSSKAPRADWKFAQPCSALRGCHCKIYPERPKYCRQFECILFKSVQAGRLEIPAALRIIRTARQKADTVRSLLRQLGNTEEQAPLAARFRQTVNDLETSGFNEETAETCGKLTLAVHDLNCLLSEAFYR